MSGATIVKQLLLAGITAVGCGAGEPAMCHAANERISISELCDFSKILALACLKLMGVD
jgi:acetylornithine deacetylase/succinyl-diaminopimelate desuccinylase-like protein